MADRWTRPLLRRIFPDRDINKYLSIGETPVLVTRPSISVWFWAESPVFASMCAVLLVTALAGDESITKIAMVVMLGLIVMLIVSFLQLWFTLYALTDHRAIHLDGVLTDRLEWMSWKKVTDVSVHRSLADRLNHTATIKVQSANEASGFKAMKGVRDPRDFAQLIADLVNEAHGPIILTPDPRRD